MNCPECGTPYSPEDLFCGQCGAILPASAPEPLPADAADKAKAPPDGSTVESPAAWPATEESGVLEPHPGADLLEPAWHHDSAVHAPAVHNSRATVVFILGLVSLGMLFVSWLPCVGILGCFQPVVAIAAIVLGAAVKRDIEKRGGLEQDRNRARQGMIMGIVALGLYVLLGILAVILGIGINLLNGF